jgi:membrane protease YdiL (CAAX protease family)
LSPRTEFFVVILVAFGYFLLGSVLSVFLPAGSGHISEGHLRFLLVYELFVFSVLWLFLHVRGWRLQQLGLRISLRDSLVGIGFVFLVYVIYIVLWLLFSGFFPEISQQSKHLVTADISLLTLILISVVNPIFEELFVCAYTISALNRSRSLMFAVNVSIAIRLTYHLYQGALSLFSVLLVGIIFAYWYARTGRLWPLILAHGLIDFLGMLPYVNH